MALKDQDNKPKAKEVGFNGVYALQILNGVDLRLMIETA